MPEIVYNPGPKQPRHSCRVALGLDHDMWTNQRRYPINSVVRCDCGRLWRSKHLSYKSDTFAKMKRVYFWHPLRYKIKGQVAA